MAEREGRERRERASERVSTWTIKVRLRVKVSLFQRMDNLDVFSSHVPS